MQFRGRVVMSGVVLAGAFGLAGCRFPEPPDRTGNTLTVHVVGPGTVSGGGIECATGDVGVCAIDVPVGAEVVLSRTSGTVGAGSQVTLGAWGGDCASAGVGASCTVVVDGGSDVSAAFSLQHRLELTVAAGGTGQGQLTAMPGTLACGTGTCSAFFDAGAVITVDSAPSTGLDLATGVSGACGALPCAVTMDGPRAVTASFTRVVCVPSSRSCTGGRFTDCDATGNYVRYDVPNGGADGTPVTLVMDDYLCPLGCHTSGTRCNDISTSLDAIMDTPEVSPAGIDLVLPRSASIPAGVITINSGSFDEATQEVVIIDADGQSLLVPASFVDLGAPFPGVLVLKVRSFTLRSGSQLRASSDPAVAIASHFDVFLAGVVDLASSRTRGPAPGSLVTFGSCTGVWDQAGSMTSGGGGGAATDGGDGTTPGTGGIAFASSGTFGGCDSTGGAGGGALQIVSRNRIALAATGGIDVSGSGGDFFGAHAFGGGGGGKVILQAPVFSAAPGSFLVGRGGSGAATNADGTVAVPGNDGPRGVVGATSVTCAGCGTSGAGGTENVNFGVGGDAVGHAGGGGGLGMYYRASMLGTNAATVRMHGSSLPLSIR